MQNGQSCVSTGRLAGIDLVKVVAILGVLMIHISAGGLQTPGGITGNWFGALFWGSISRASVPLFFLCSGAMMLDPNREYPLKKLFGHNLLHILAALFCWALAYRAYHLWAEGAWTAAAVVQAGKDVLLFRHEFHLYYLHIIIMGYLWLPVTRLIVRSATKRELEYLLALWLLFGIFYPTARQFWPLNLLKGIPLQYAINMTYSAIGYGVAGYYLRTWPPCRRTAQLMAGVGLMIVFGGTAWLSIRQGALATALLEGMSPGAALYALGLFGWLVSVRPAKPDVVRQISGASFCVYLVHMFWVYLLQALGFSVQRLPYLVSIPLLVLAVFVLSFVTWLVLRRIPGVRRWLI